MVLLSMQASLHGLVLAMSQHQHHGTSHFREEQQSSGKKLQQKANVAMKIYLTKLSALHQ